MASKKLFDFPVVRRVFPSTMAHEIVSVQPMTMPISSFIFMGVATSPRQFKHRRQPFKMLMQEKEKE